MRRESSATWRDAALKLIGASSSTSAEKKEDVDDDSELPFGLRSHMLSESHALLYRALVAALAAEAVVFAKVRLADFLYVSGGGDDLKHAIKMDRKFVDFLLCDPFTMQPLAVIELKRSGNPDEQRSRDPFIARALKTAEITMLRIEARNSYPVAELRSALLPKIEAQHKASTTKTPQEFPAIHDSHRVDPPVSAKLTNTQTTSSTSANSAPEGAPTDARASDAPAKRVSAASARDSASA